MKLIKGACLAVVLAASSPSFASDQPANRSVGAGDIAAETFLRPAGFIATVIGGGLFLAFLPPVAINSIIEPHEPITDWANLMVVNPAKFTFSRPMGDYSYPSLTH